MSRTVFCQKLQQDDEGLAFVPWPGAIGKRVFEHIGKQAWQQWLAARSGPREPVRPADGDDPPLVDAPGTYVLER